MKAQIKMGETVAIMIVFFLLVAFGLGFYVQVQEHYFEKEQAKILQLKGLQISQKASYLPELQCSVQNIQYDNCFDIDKAEIFFEVVNGSDEKYAHYYDIFGSSTLYLQEVYPNSGKTYMIYDASLPNERGTNTLTSVVPVSLFDGKQNVFSIGVLVINHTDRDLG
ncbi:hypothetical protein H6504_03465 [Candidatus Woesearchaeota archaeon]|nr:hypothetical protein [Candidatus Woesearchaeota archaeon]